MIWLLYRMMGEDGWTGDSYRLESYRPPHFEALGYEVVKLDRSVYATLDKKDLPHEIGAFTPGTRPSGLSTLCN